MTKTSGDIVSNLANLLPTGTFLTYQAIVPLFTNNGHCGHVEKIMTGILTLIFCIINFVLTFTDSITTTSGKHYYGLVTCSGLYNPQFKDSAIASVNGSTFTGNTARLKATIWDFINGALCVVVFATLVLLTTPVSTCYWPRLPNTIIKTVPILVGIVASLYFSFAPPARKGVGFSMAGLVTEPVDDTTEHTVPAGTTANPSTTANPTVNSLLSDPEKTGHSTSPVHTLSISTKP